MSLSTDLISQFVKVTKDESKTKTETTVYGTIVESDGTKYVQLDGADTPTPISSTASVNVGDRVTVLIKNHTAIITGNISSPSASSEDVEALEEDTANKITEFEIAIGQKADVEQLNAESARIDSLTAETVAIKGMLTASDADIENLVTDMATINEKLTANSADIEDLKTSKLDADMADITYAKITDLDATNATVHNLEATYAEFAETTTEKLEATEANIEKLDTEKLSASEADLKYATIVDLDVEKARIDDLEAEVGEIDTLIFGSATGSTIQASFANAVVAQLSDAQIKSAMIESVSADKINSGEINTNKVGIASEDGNLVISDETIQISDSARVRVQIGKDATGDYSINIWDADGNLMFSEGGITDSAIKDAIIRNDMVSDTANIAAHKLDIDSLFEEINGSTQTIKSTQISMDDEGQTLKVAFESMSSDIEEIQNGVSSQGTAIEVIQGQISSKIWEQDINTAVSDIATTTETLSTQYEEIEQNVEGLSATVANHSSELEKKADSTEVTEVSEKVTSLETDLEGFQTTVSETYASKSEIGTVNLVNEQSPGSPSVGEWSYVGDGWIRCVLDNSEGTSVTYATYCFPFSDYVDKLAANTPMTVTLEMRDLGSTDGTYAYAYPENDEGVNRIQVKGPTYVYAVNARDGISMARNTSAFVMPESTSGLPKTALGGYIVAAPAGGTADVLLRQGIYEGEYLGNYVAPVTDVRSLTSRVSNAETSISQNSTSITSLAERTESVENKFDDYSTTSEMTSMIEQTADSINSTVSATYSTKDETASAIENIQVGGRNLLLDSETELIVDRNYAHNLAPVELTNTDAFTYSVWMKASEETTVRVYINDDSAQGRIALIFSESTAVGTEYQRLTFIGKNVNSMPTTTLVPDTSIRMRVHAPEGITLTGKMAKLEIGNKVTDWTPAPEDMATANELSSVESSIELTEERVTTTETLIQQLSDCISMLVTDGNGQSLMTQTDTGWTFSTGELQDIVDATSENLGALTDEVGDVNSAVGVLQQAVDELDVLNDYVKIGTYEDEPCIELGETDSDFKLIITNTRIMFMEGTGVPAYITNQALNIKKAVIEEELQQGEFIWKSRANGNMGLVWKGATS